MPVSERNALARVVDSSPFSVVVVATIGVNAVVLGLQTYDGLEDRWGSWLDALNAACLGVFIVELLIRIASYWPRPWVFFRNGWNVFDFVVVTAAFVPGIRQNSTLLRLVRLLRVVRLDVEVELIATFDHPREQFVDAILLFIGPLAD